MRLFIVRHGQSPAAHEAGVPTDALRPLAELGREDVRRTAEAIKDRGGRPDRILTSPLVRARQTADILAEVLEPAAAVEVFEDLDGTASGQEVWDDLKRLHGSDRQVVLVGHMPSVSEIVHYLTGRSASFRPGACCEVFLDAPKDGGLVWSFDP